MNDDDDRELSWLVIIRIAAGVATMGFGLAILTHSDKLHGFLSSPRLFPYPGFAWLPLLPRPYLPALAAILVAAGAAVVLGFFYRAAIAVAALGCAYFFFLDSGYYQSTAYLSVLLLFLLCFLPAHHLFAIDARKIARPGQSAVVARRLLQFQIGCVYVFSGIAKWDADWLSGRALRAMCPLYPPVMWLGRYVNTRTVFAAASWLGMLVDLLIVPFLLWRRTRAPAFLILIAFHLHNALTLEVGVVPWSMLVVSTVFLPPDWPRRLRLPIPTSPRAEKDLLSRIAKIAIAGFIILQIALPLRRWVYRGNPYFHEIGFHFAWALRSRAKTAVTTLRIVDRATRQERRLVMTEGLPEEQGARAAGDPYSIWTLAHEVARTQTEMVFADSTVELNGASGPLIDPHVDLLRAPCPLLGVPTWVANGVDSSFQKERKK